MPSSPQIRVAHIVGKWIGGGVESSLMNYYRNIDRSKIQFDFLCDSDSINIPFEEIDSLGGRVIIIPPYQKLSKYNKELYAIFKENNYKIVHSHINTISVFPLRIAKKANIPNRIAHSHATSNRKEWKKNIIKQFLRPLSKVYPTHYMSCSNLAGQWLFGKDVHNNGQIYILHNAIDIKKFQYNEFIRKEQRSKLKIDSDTLVIGHIGRFVHQKNHSFLIDIFNEIHKTKKNSILLLIGQGPLVDQMKEKVRKLNLTESVKFLGQINNVSDLYQAFDIFLLPSLYEGLPVVGIEAQATGLHCIFSDNVTSEVKILAETKFLSLSQSNKHWAKVILEEHINFKRTKDGLKFYDYDITQQASRLEALYLSMLDKDSICQ